MSEAVQNIYDAWGNRASLKEPDLVSGGERVFKIGGHTISIPDDAEQPAKVAHVYNRWGQSENPMPNLSFSDGEMRIPVEDFVDLILRRVPADELAEGLWHDESVRDRFVYCMANRFGGGAIEDGDRRKLLREIQVAIHAVAIDEAVARLNKAEENARSYTNHYRWQKFQCGHYSGLYDRYKTTLLEMRENDLLTDEQVASRLASLTTPEKLTEYAEGMADPVIRESVGPEWYDSRDFWRARLMEFFPAPASGIEAATAGETQGGSIEDESPTGEAGDAQ